MERYRCKNGPELFSSIVILENSVLLIVIVFFKPAEETTLFNRFVYELASKQFRHDFLFKRRSVQIW